MHDGKRKGRRHFVRWKTNRPIITISPSRTHFLFQAIMKLFTNGVISLLISGNHVAGFVAKSQTPRSSFVNLSSVHSHFSHQRQTSRLSVSTPEMNFSEHSEAPESLQATLESAFENAFEATPQQDQLQRFSFVESLRLMDKNELINNLVLASTVVAVGMALIHIDASFPHHGVSNIFQRIEQVPMEAWNSYEYILKQSPIATKAATSATVYTIGDVLAQQTEGAGMGQLDRGRILRSLLAGGIGHGPLSHFWYNFCDNIFTNVLHLTQWWSVIPKIVVDQTIWGTIWNNTYIIMLGLMKFDSGKNIWSDMKQSTIPLFISGLRLWPLAHCVTYSIPLENRLVWVDAVEILWVTILASQAAAISKQHEEPAFVGEPATIEAVSLAK